MEPLGTAASWRKDATDSGFIALSHFLPLLYFLSVGGNVITQLLLLLQGLALPTTIMDSSPLVL